MNKKNKIVMVSIISILIIIFAIFYNINIDNYTFTLSSENSVKNEQIQPINGEVEVVGTADTNVDFTDIESGEKYSIGYITPGMIGKVKLKKGKWYIVEGNGELTISPVNIRNK